MDHDQSDAGSLIPSPAFLSELEKDDLRNGYVEDRVRVRVALLVRALREQRGWSQLTLAAKLNTTQSVVSRLENPDYGRVSVQTLLDVAAVFGLPLYIDMPAWEDWFILMSKGSTAELARLPFNKERLTALRRAQSTEYLPMQSFSAPITPPVVIQRNSPYEATEYAVPGGTDYTGRVVVLGGTHSDPIAANQWTVTNSMNKALVT